MRARGHGDGLKPETGATALPEAAIDLTGLRPYSPETLSQPTLDLAPRLLGAYLVRQTVDGPLVARIVETEAYLSSGDAACHANRGQTPRNRTMFGKPGHAYVYLIYGIYHCFNVVTEPEGCGAAVLVRAVEPLYGLARMAVLRKLAGQPKPADLTAGPGRLCQALAIDKALDGLDLRGPGPLVLLAPPAAEVAKETILTSPRIGITVATELPGRFYLAGNPWVSRRPPASAN